jgi:hypothetical protein
MSWRRLRPSLRTSAGVSTDELSGVFMALLGKV